MKVFAVAIFVGNKKILKSENEFTVEIERELSKDELWKIVDNGMVRVMDALIDLEDNNPNFHRLDGGKTEEGLTILGLCIAETRQHAQKQCDELANEVIKNNWHK